MSMTRPLHGCKEQVQGQKVLKDAQITRATQHKPGQVSVTCACRVFLNTTKEYIVYMHATWCINMASAAGHSDQHAGAILEHRSNESGWHSTSHNDEGKPSI